MGNSFKLFTHVTDRDVPKGEEDTITLFKGTDGEFYWHRQASGNNEILCDGGQGYATDDDAQKGIIRVSRGPYRLVIEVE